MLEEHCTESSSSGTFNTLNVKAERAISGAKIKHEAAFKLQNSSAVDTSRDFLFDPFAAAYYSRFSDYLPGKHSLNALLASQRGN